MSKLHFILVGAKPVVDPKQHPGGQLTASIGLAKYAEKKGYRLDVIDITQSSFPVPGIGTRLIKGVYRLCQLIALLQKKDVEGVILFSSNLLSFYERVCMSAVCRIYRVRDLFFNRSGHFITANTSSAIVQKISGLLLKIPARIGVQGSLWRDFYKQLGVVDNRIVVIPNWLPDDMKIEETKRVPKDKNMLRFIFVGWVNKEKGIEELLDAVKELMFRYTFKLIIVGSGKLDAHVKLRMTEEKMEEFLVVTGWQDRESLQLLLKDSDVFIIPSYAEGFPNALLEAMAIGLPAICTDVGGISDSIKDSFNGYLIRPKDSNEIVCAMERYLNNPDIIPEHSEKTLEKVRENHMFEQNCSKVFGCLLKNS